MGAVNSYPPVKLITAITAANVNIWPNLKNKLEKTYSPIEDRLDWYEFTHTRYYEPEMGEGLRKCMISFQDLILAEQLPEIKLKTNQVEAEFAVDGKRFVNIDPGYICSSKLVLATTKDFSHRIFLGKGIFGDLHLRYYQRTFHPQEWTYPDYKEPFVLHFFEKVRKNYLSQLAEQVF